jgi:hypothetical protein
MRLSTQLIIVNLDLFSDLIHQAVLVSPFLLDILRYPVYLEPLLIDTRGSPYVGAERQTQQSSCLFGLRHTLCIRGCCCLISGACRFLLLLFGLEPFSHTRYVLVFVLKKHLIRCLIPLRPFSLSSFGSLGCSLYWC